MIIKIREKIVLYRNKQQCHQVNYLNQLNTTYIYIPYSPIQYWLVPISQQVGHREFRRALCRSAKGGSLILGRLHLSKACVELLVDELTTDSCSFRTFRMHTLIWYSIKLGQNSVIVPNLSNIFQHMIQIRMRSYTHF